MKIANCKSQIGPRRVGARKAPVFSPCRRFCILHFAICLLTFASALFVSGCDRGPSAAKADRKQAQPNVVPVTVTPVRTQKVQRTVEFVGTLYANEEVAVSREIEGRILSVAADLGDRVGAGQALAKIHDAEFRFAVEQSEASLRETL